jgi:hypothetical protein
VNDFQSKMSPAAPRHGSKEQCSSLSDLSQHDTEQSVDESSDQWGCAGSSDSFESHYNTFAVLAIEAYGLWESSNFASVCSSATTVAPATMRADTAVSAATSSGLAPSFDFIRPIFPSAMSDFSVRHPHHWNPLGHPGEFIGRGQYSPWRRDPAASVDPSQLPSLSVGSGYAMDAAHHGGWQEPSAVALQDLEEYSLGSGYPAMYHSPGYPI